MSNETGHSTPQSEVLGLLSTMDSRLEKIEGKLDDHLVRVARAEQDIHWLRGHVRTATAIFLAVVGFFGTILFNIITGNNK